MYKAGAIGVLLMVLGCNSTHPIMESDPIDLSVTQIATLPIGYPLELADTLGWGHIGSVEQSEEGDEFIINLYSNTEPFHLFRMQRSKNTDGLGVLYWPKGDGRESIRPHENMSQYLVGTCKEILETANFEYCIPELSRSLDWGATMNTIIERSGWNLTDQEFFEQDTSAAQNPWTIEILMRHENYYRVVSHSNPESYTGEVKALNILAVAAQMRMITQAYLPPENFNIYEGITSGVGGSEFTVCDTGERWRFNGNLKELITSGGVPATIEAQDSLLFYVNVQGTVQDEWYAQRSGYTKVITPTEINNVVIVSSKKCPIIFD